MSMDERYEMMAEQEANEDLTFMNDYLHHFYEPYVQRILKMEMKDLRKMLDYLWDDFYKQHPSQIETKAGTKMLLDIDLRLADSYESGFHNNITKPLVVNRILKKWIPPEEPFG